MWVANPPQSEKKAVILAVDDHPSILRFIHIGLEIRGLNVVTANSGKDALEKVESAKPNVVLLDMVMPDIDGLEVLRRVRSVSQVPVIAFSANENLRDQAMRSGANDFVVKPFNTDEMVAKIKKLLENEPK